MMNNKEKFLALVSGKSEETAQKNAWRIANREWLQVSGDIAFKILEKLDELGWTQKELAERMEVSPQYISKMLKGSENLTLESLTKIQRILDIPILASFYEQKHEKVVEFKGEERLTIMGSGLLVEYQREVSLKTEYITKEDFPSYKFVG